MLERHEIEIRVRYQETDGQGRVHHANFLTYFEQARVEMLRAAGHSYRELEASGVLLVVAEFHIEYVLAAVYDDLLRVVTVVERATGARITHHYEVFRADELIVRARSTVACVDQVGRAKRLPDWLRKPRS